MIRYTKLFHIMLDRDIKVQDLRNATKLSQPTISKLRKGETIQTDAIDKICEFLDCQPGDIMEYVKEKTDENPNN